MQQFLTLVMHSIAGIVAFPIILNITGLYYKLVKAHTVKNEGNEVLKEGKKWSQQLYCWIFILKVKSGNKFLLMNSSLASSFLTVKIYYIIADKNSTIFCGYSRGLNRLVGTIGSSTIPFAANITSCKNRDFNYRGFDFHQQWMQTVASGFGKKV